LLGQNGTHLGLLLLLVGPNGDGFGGQASMEHYTRFLVVERSKPWQDYTIHPYFVLGTAFPPRPLSSCPDPSLQKLSVPHILFEKVIPPSHRTAEPSPLFTDKTERQNEKPQNNDPVSDFELFESPLPFLFCLILILSVMYKLLCLSRVLFLLQFLL
jgi:hypothetical protein